jgi:hypothetical protein
MGVQSHALSIQHEKENRTYPFILPQASIFVIRRRQVRSRRAYRQRSFCMEVLRVDRQPSISHPQPTIIYSYTHLDDLI